jgi:hypothetical protein
VKADLPMGDELRGLLVELAEEPERTVLGTRVRRFNDLLRPDVEVLRPTTGMGFVEAKLLEAHREELAWLLLQACRIAVDSAPLLAPRDREGGPKPAGPAFAHRASSYVALHDQGTHPFGAVTALLRFCEDPQAIPPMDLAVASMRLVPSGTSKSWVGVHHGLNDEHQRGLRLQESVIHGLTTAMLAGYAWNNVAWHQCALGRLHDSMEAARQASFMAPELARGAAGWFACALQLGEAGEAIEAAHALADLGINAEGEIEDYAAQTTRLRACGTWLPTRDARSLCDRLRGTLKPAAEKLIEVF